MGFKKEERYPKNKRKQKKPGSTEALEFHQWRILVIHSYNSNSLEYNQILVVVVDFIKILEPIATNGPLVIPQAQGA